MINAQNIFKDIQTLTSQLISVNLSVEQNFPTLKTISQNRTNISYTGSFDLSIALKNIPYKNIYDELNENRNFNIKMIDGALIQYFYNTAYTKYSEKLQFNNYRFEETITNLEKTILHLAML